MLRNLLLLAPLLGGCGVGALQQSVTGDRCGPEDLQCLMRGLGAPLAVGATAEPSISLRLRGSGAPSLRLVSPTEAFTVFDHRITGRSEGIGTLLMTMEDDAVIDFVHVWVREASHIELHRTSETGSDLGAVQGRIELLPGESLRLAAHPYRDAQRLLGEAEPSIEIEPPIASVLSEGILGRRRLLAKRPGTATVTVTAFGKREIVELVVHPRVAP